jgi:hypothetical protein
MITKQRLRHLLTLVKQAYFRRAAGVLNISPPAHTKSIEVLESELVVTLLEFRWVASRLPARVAANLPRSIRRAGKIDVLTGDFVLAIEMDVPMPRGLHAGSSGRRGGYRGAGRSARAATATCFRLGRLAPIALGIEISAR